LLAKYFVPALVISLIVFFPQNLRAEDAGDPFICPFCCSNQSRVLMLTDPPLQGDDVLELQEALFNLGFYKLARNGIYNRETEKSVCAFQKKFGLAADGKVVDKTWSVITQQINMLTPVKIEPPPEGKKIILIDTTKRKLTLFCNGEPYRQFPVAVGKPETPTPIGKWRIARKALNWGIGFGTRWMGLNVNWGIYGIHGTNKLYSIGDYQSHGCIRMHNRNVEQLYPLISVGTPVIITGNPFTYLDPPYKKLRHGDKGAAVMEVQRSLKQLGYDIDIDGIWGNGMEKTVIQYRKDTGLPFDNAVDDAVYKSLGIKG